MVTSYWLQKHDTVFFLQHFPLIPLCFYRGLRCNLVIISTAIPFRIVTTFKVMLSYKRLAWHHRTVQVSTGLFIPTTVHSCGFTVILRSLGYRDNGYQCSFWSPSCSRNSPILGLFCQSVCASVSPLDTRTIHYLNNLKIIRDHVIYHQI